MTRSAIGLVAALFAPACVGSAPTSARSVDVDAPASASSPVLVVHVTARRFEFTPAVIRLKLDEPVVIELTTLDRRHGFAAPDFQVDETIAPGAATFVRLTPSRVGEFPFYCSVFCGDGHETMGGRIVVER